MEARTPFSAGDFRRRAANLAASAATDGEDGDHRLNPDLRHLIVRPGLRDAAVLIGVVDHGDDATVLLTKRTETMRSHSGQIAFRRAHRPDRCDAGGSGAARNPGGGRHRRRGHRAGRPASLAASGRQPSLPVAQSLRSHQCPDSATEDGRPDRQLPGCPKRPGPSVRSGLAQLGHFKALVISHPNSLGSGRGVVPEIVGACDPDRDQRENEKRSTGPPCRSHPFQITLRFQRLCPSDGGPRRPRRPPPFLPARRPHPAWKEPRPGGGAGERQAPSGGRSR